MKRNTFKAKPTMVYRVVKADPKTSIRMCSTTKCYFSILLVIIKQIPYSCKNNGCSIIGNNPERYACWNGHWIEFYICFKFKDASIMSSGEINLTFNIINFRFNVTVNIIITSNVFTMSTLSGFRDNVSNTDIIVINWPCSDMHRCL